MSAPIPSMSQYQGQTYIKQMEDVFLPPQPFVNKGFPHQGQPLRAPQYAQLPTQPIQKQVYPDFLPFHKDFNRYLYNKIIGYTDRDVTYPIRTTGFATTGL